MIYSQLFDRVRPQTCVRAGIIGTGDFSTAIIAQSNVSRRLKAPVVSDLSVERARIAIVQAGFDESRIQVCGTLDAALRALAQDAVVVVEDPLLMMKLPVDVVVEATGDPEAGALHAREAIARQKHVAMVNKETDAVVGPILKHLADRAGVVYTAVDGDQHGLLMGLMAWTRELGLEVMCGGKVCDTGVRFDPGKRSLCVRKETIALNEENAEFFHPILEGQVDHFIEKRSAILGEASRIKIYDYEELVIAANATGLVVDTEELHHPVLRTVEIPQALCPKEEGGIFQARGVVDAVIELRDPTAPGLGGGVFVVVACDSDESRRILKRKGLVSNCRGSMHLIYRPYHLCGVEASFSILCAGLLGLPTGSTDYRPRFDAVARVSRRMKAGETVQLGDLRGLVRPARPVAAGVPLPLRMAVGRPLTVDVAPGTLITTEMVVAPSESHLWSLRAEQDERFLKENSSEQGAPADG